MNVYIVRLTAPLKIIQMLLFLRIIIIICCMYADKNNPPWTNMTSYSFIYYVVIWSSYSRVIVSFSVL